MRSEKGHLTKNILQTEITQLADRILWIEDGRIAG